MKRQEALLSVRMGELQLKVGKFALLVAHELQTARIVEAERKVERVGGGPAVSGFSASAWGVRGGLTRRAASSTYWSAKSSVCPAA